MVLFDRFGRPIYDLRIAVTAECNLDCIFCHREGIWSESFYKCFKRPGATQYLTPEVIQKVVKVAADFGVKSVKITGGEPLLRPDIVEIIDRISAINSIKDLSMVTNGLLLRFFAKKIKKAGLKRINVSLHSLNEETYKRVTRSKSKDNIRNIIEGIEIAKDSGLNPVKVNVLILKGYNEKEINDFLKFGAELGVVLQFIELQEPNGYQSEFFRDHFYSLESLEKQLEKEASKIIVREMQHRRRYILPSGLEVELVRPMFNPDFCAHCTRLRVTATGEFKPCLMRDDNHVPFLDVISNEEALKERFLEAVKRREPFFK